MTVGQMVRRHHSDVGHAMFGRDFPSFRDLRDKKVSAEQREMLAAVKETIRHWPISMLKRSGLKPSQLRATARRQFAAWEKIGIRPGLVVIDHLGLMRPEKSSSSRYADQSEIIIAVQSVADDLQVPIMALAQLTREVERRDTKRPQMADLRDSGLIEECADVILFPFRDSYYAQREEPPERTANGGVDWSEWDRRAKSMDLEIIPAKVREGAAAKSSRLWIDVGWNAVRSFEPAPKGAMI